MAAIDFDIYYETLYIELLKKDFFPKKGQDYRKEYITSFHKAQFDESLMKILHNSFGNIFDKLSSIFALIAFSN